VGLGVGLELRGRTDSRIWVSPGWTDNSTYPWVSPGWTSTYPESLGYESWVML